MQRDRPKLSTRHRSTRQALLSESRDLLSVAISLAAAAVARSSSCAVEPEMEGNEKKEEQKKGVPWHVDVSNAAIRKLFDENHKSYLVTDKDLPVKLPDVKNYEPTGDGESPLKNIKNWVEVYGIINKDGEFEEYKKKVTK